MNIFSGRKTLLFDLDGTLINSTADLTASGNHIRQALGKSRLSESQVAGYIGDGVKVLVQKLVETEEDAVVGPSIDAFIHHYHIHCLDRTTLYGGVEETLRELSTKFKMAVVTNKPERISSRIIEGLKLSELLPVVVGGNTGLKKKPDPEPLRIACQRLESSLDDCIMIGDSHVDVQAARNAEIPVIAFTFGIGDQDKLVQSKPDLLLNDFREIGTFLTF